MPAGGPVRLMLCGDVMLGRGIDQVLPRPGDPVLYESYVASALDYVALAEQANGPIRRPVPLAYPFGDALDVLDAARPDVRIVNLETAVTRRGEPARKGIHYRMSPENAAALRAARIDCCVLANNHVLDWGETGLLDTLDTLDALAIATVGAGRDAEEAARPAILPLPGRGRVLVYALGCPSSGIPARWAAGPGRPGVNYLAHPSEGAAERLADRILAARQPGDLVVVSIHWGGNWGFEIPVSQRLFARTLIDAGAANFVHGHSSHHPKAIELYGRGAILYGSGDFINDYEGIAGYEAYRGDLCCLYLPSFGDGWLQDFRIVPFEIRNFRLHRASEANARWLHVRLARECGRFDTEIRLEDGPVMTLRPARAAAAPEPPP